MASAGFLIDDVLRRVRDPQGTATSRAQVLDLLDRCQVLIVRQTGIRMRDRSTTTVDSKLIYKVDTRDFWDRPNILRIADIYNADTNKRLSKCRWTQLVQAGGTQWWRVTSSLGPTTWAPLGTNYYFLYPASDSNLVNLTIREQQAPTTLDAESVELDLPLEHIPALLDLVEALVLFHMRGDSLTSAVDLLEASHGQS